MLKKRIIPCLDVKHGRVVKGTNFINLKDVGDPVLLALHYDQEGADELVFLDITASSDERTIFLDVVKKTAASLFIPFTVGGGIRDIETIYKLLDAGADKVSINTAAITNPNLIAEASSQFGSQCIVVAIDAKKTAANITPKTIDLPQPLKSVALTPESIWEIYTHGGRCATGIDALKWAAYMTQLGAGEILLTSMDRDGTKTGFDISLTEAISKKVTIPVIASGGAGCKEDVSAVLKVCEASLLASLLHYKQVSINTLKKHCIEQNIPMRKKIKGVSL